MTTGTSTQFLLMKNFLKTSSENFSRFPSKGPWPYKNLWMASNLRQEHAKYIFTPVVQGAKDDHFNSDCRGRPGCRVATNPHLVMNSITLNWPEGIELEIENPHRYSGDTAWI